MAVVGILRDQRRVNPDATLQFELIHPGKGTGAHGGSLTKSISFIAKPEVGIALPVKGI